MKSITALLWATCMLLAGVAAAAQTATGPAAEATEEDKDKLAARALVEAAKQSFVIVKIWYKKDTSEPLSRTGGDWRVRRIYDEYVDKKLWREQPGVVLDAHGHVLIPDDGLEDRFCQKLEVQTIEGQTMPAAREALLLDAPGEVLKVPAAAAAKLTPPTFVELKTDDPETTLLQAYLHKVDDCWRIYTGPVRPGAMFAPGERDNAFYGFGRGLEGAWIAADEQGAPVGCCMASRFDLKQTECLWRGPDLQAAERVSFQRLKELQDACRKELTAAAQEIVIVLHQGAASEMDRYRITYPPSRGPSGPSGKEINFYGVAISDTEILVPAAMEREAAARIDKIYVRFSPQDRLGAEFVGAYKDFAAFVVKLRKGKLPAHVGLAREDLPRMRPFWVAALRKKFGNKHVDLVTNRLYRKQQGYAGKYHWTAARSINPGSLLVDFDGHVAGLYLQQRIEHEEQRQLERGQESYYYPRTWENRIFTISELRDDLTQPIAHMDPKIEVKPPALAKRRAWLGVEFVHMTAALAEQMKVETPTKDGKLGFLVNAVYAGSPGEKLGIIVGDILLRLKAPGVPYPIQLTSGERDYDVGPPWGAYPRDAEDDLAGPLEPSWKSRANFLTKALDAIGVGQKVTITYYRPAAGGKGEARTVQYTIELAPPDLDSAPKWVNRKLGLTVKEATYEVRHALNLAADEPGVIVAKIEHGSPTVVARIFPNEIIQRLDETPIRSPRHMRDLIAKAHQAGRQKVRLTILRLGRTRFADLNISDYDAKDDEGLDEGED